MSNQVCDRVRRRTSARDSSRISTVRQGMTAVGRNRHDRFEAADPGKLPFFHVRDYDVPAPLARSDRTMSGLSALSSKQTFAAHRGAGMTAIGMRLTQAGRLRASLIWIFQNWLLPRGERTGYACDEAVPNASYVSGTGLCGLQLGQLCPARRLCCNET